MIKHIIFDFDGTLVDSKDLAIEVINTLAPQYNFSPLTKSEIEKLRKYSIKKRLEILQFPLYKLPFAMIDFLKLYQNSINQLRLFDGIKSVLRELAQAGFQLSIISSNSRKNIYDFLRENKITSVSEIHCSTNLFGKDKMINSFIKKHRLKRAEVLYIGDELRDIEACKRVGIPIVWVTWGFDAIDVTHIMKPNFIVNKPEEIISIAKAFGEE